MGDYFTKVQLMSYFAGGTGLSQTEHEELQATEIALQVHRHRRVKYRQNTEQMGEEAVRGTITNSIAGHRKV